MEKPWMPVVGGILDIVSGAFGVVVGLFVYLHLHAARAAQATSQTTPKVATHAGALNAMPHLFSRAWA